MCVIAKRVGCFRGLAHASRTWTFLKRLHVCAQRFLCLRPYTSETSIAKIGDNSRDYTAVNCVSSDTIFIAPLGDTSEMQDGGCQR